MTRGAQKKRSAQLDREIDEALTGGSHATKRSTSRSAWPSVVGGHGLGTADVRTGDGAYWIVTVPTGYRVNYKPWGPSNEIDLGTFPSRQRARTKITAHAGGAGGLRSHSTKKAGGSAQEPITEVMFRVFPEGDVIALFPQDKQGAGLINSYQHLGQHGEASQQLVKELRRASPAEYAPLLAELKRIGYRLRIGKRQV